jgi:hypothetical protein
MAGHFPQFLLRNWATAGVAYYFVHPANKVIDRNASVASACQIPDLNSAAGAIAKHMKRTAIAPDIVLCSTAVRTKETIEPIARS